MPEETVSLVLQARDQASAVINKNITAINNAKAATTRLSASQNEVLSSSLRDYWKSHNQSMVDFRREASKTNTVIGETPPILKKTAAGANALTTALRRLGAVILAYFTVGFVVRFIRSSIEAFSKQEEATAVLRQSLARLGAEGEVALQKLEDRATAIERQFRIADEVMLEATATVARFAPSLKTPDLIKAQMALVGLTEVLGSTETAGTLLGKSLGSNTNLLSRYGIQITNTATAQEKLNQIIAAPAVASAIDAQAARALTLHGRIEGVRLAWDSLSETLGGIIVDMLGVGDKASSLEDRLIALDEAIRDNREGWIRFGRVSTAVIIALATIVRKQVHIIVDSISLIGTGISELFQSIRLSTIRTTNVVGSAVSKLAELRDALTPGDQAIKFTPIDTTALEAGLEETRAVLRAKGQLIAEDVREIKDALDSVAEAISSPLPPAPTGRAGPRTPEEVIEAAKKSKEAELPPIPEELEGPPLEMIPDMGFDTALEFLQAVNLARQALQDLTGEGVTFGEAFQKSINEAIPAVRNLKVMLAETAATVALDFGGAFQDSIANVVSGSESMGSAFAEAFSSAIGAAATTMANYFTALGFAALGMTLVPPPLGTPTGGAAAAKFFAAAAAMHAVAGLARGAAGGGGGGGGGGGSAGRASDLAGRRQGDFVLVLPSGVLDMTNPRVEEAVADAFGEITGRRVITRRNG